MTTPYDRDIKRQVMAHNQAFVDRLKVLGRGDILGINTNTSYQTYKPSTDEVRYNTGGALYGSGMVEMGAYEPRMFGNGYAVLEQPTPMDMPDENVVLKQYVKGISHGGGKGRKAYKKGGAHLEGAGFWDSISSGLSDVWSGVKSVASDVVDDTQDVFHAGLDLATQAGQTGIGLAGQAGEMAIQHAPEIMQFVAENPELLAGAGKKKKAMAIKKLVEEHKRLLKALKSGKVSKKVIKEEHDDLMEKAEGGARLGVEWGAGMSGGKAKKTSAWITHVKAYAVKHKINYRDALRSKECKDSYKKVGAGMSGGKKHKKLKGGEIAGEILDGGKKHKKEVEEVMEGGYWNAEEPKLENKIKGRKKDVKLQDVPEVKVLGGAKPKKTSAWITHVKAYAVKHKCNYRDALRSKECRDSYKK